MSSSAPRRNMRFLPGRQGLSALVGLMAVAVVYGMRDRHSDSTEVRAPATAAPSGSSPATPARLESLEAGLAIPVDQPPPGWTHLVSKSIPKLESGDLDTVSDQAHVIASRIRPVIAADVKKDEGGTDSSYHLVRVGMGLCAPAVAEGQDIVITRSKVEGTRGEWTTKERLILTAMAYETSKATLVASTPTFALVRTPVNSLVSGTHKKLDSYHAILADPQTGSVRTIIWQAGEDDKSGVPRAEALSARLMKDAVYSCAMDVHATKLPGGFPISWSFAIRGLPPGDDVSLPASFIAELRDSDAASAAAPSIERRLRDLVVSGTTSGR